ncbi:uncharacterized protein LACBIDRAFT_324587 [Laccaria bicolor S238N-H82]|uniref:Predicted protein n=1 Tax=Laccaria bicolor (strain S238N-H82 / ATCC MYA-4686) TaxID=486041 RepID=B0D2E1_LACBS|nr:uncharacterized protein LACBIDRAFT_324587 [Laccaria bicolor S238N-H82]EDR10730.1 predicted protein [Laccaria bicolor S238N-H82]|eukprot:XP_001878031.1 predicted protein [Laccaria bicolor S238N-H82]
MERKQMGGPLAPKAAPARRKKGKHFLAKNEALELAASIAGAQEQKALRKAEKHHQAQPHHRNTDDEKPRLSNSKLKIKETKALLAAQRARSKKDKAKKRKRRSQDATFPPDDNDGHARVGLLSATTKPARKKVSFA